MLNYQRVSRLEVLSFIVVVPTFSGWMPDIGTQYICLFCLLYYSQPTPLCCWVFKYFQSCLSLSPGLILDLINLIVLFRKEKHLKCVV